MRYYYDKKLAIKCLKLTHKYIKDHEPIRHQLPDVAYSQGKR